MDEAVKLLIEILKLVILGPDSAWTKIVLISGLFIWFIFPIAIFYFVITFVAEEAKRFSSKIHGR